MTIRLLHIPSLLMLVLMLLACDRTPGGVMSVNEMADLIVDLQLADAYIESHPDEFMSDSSKLVIKESIFKRHHITAKDYDSSLVWYAHNPEDYTKAHDKALSKLQSRHDKLTKGKNKIDDNEVPGEMMGGPVTGEPTHDATPRGGKVPRKRLSNDTRGDSADLWQGRRDYTLTQGARRGFITFELPPDANKRPGDRYQLSYKLARGGNEFKVCLSLDYTDGGTTQLVRGTNSDGWVSVDLQSDSTRRVRRVYGYVSYDIKRGHVAHVDSLMLMRTHLNPANYGIINAQRKLERKKDK